MHPAPPDVVADLRNARRMLGDTVVRSMEFEHVFPKSRYLRSVRGMIGFAADGKTPNDAMPRNRLSSNYWVLSTRPVSCA